MGVTWLAQMFSGSSRKEKEFEPGLRSRVRQERVEVKRRLGRDRRQSKCGTIWIERRAEEDRAESTQERHHNEKCPKSEREGGTDFGRYSRCSGRLCPLSAGRYLGT